MKRITFFLAVLSLFYLFVWPGLSGSGLSHAANIVQVSHSYYGGYSGVYHGGHHGAWDGPRYYYPPVWGYPRVVRPYPCYPPVYGPRYYYPQMGFIYSTPGFSVGVGF